MGRIFQRTLQSNREQRNKKFISNTPEIIEPYILKCEMEQDIKANKCSKSAGVDGLTSEVIKAGDVSNWLVRIVDTVGEVRIFPEDWQ